MAAMTIDLTVLSAKIKEEKTYYGYTDRLAVLGKDAQGMKVWFKAPTSMNTDYIKKGDEIRVRLSISEAKEDIVFGNRAKVIAVLDADFFETAVG